MNRRQMLGKLTAAVAAGIAGTLTRPNVPTPPALRAEDITWSGMTADRFSVANLSEFGSPIGHVVSGTIRNGSETRAIRLDRRGAE